MNEQRLEFYVIDKGNLEYIPRYGRSNPIKTWYFSLPGEEHVPGRYTLRWRQYKNGDGFLQIKKNPYKFKKKCSFAQACKIFFLEKKTGDKKADNILQSIGPTQVVFIVASIREHFCESKEENVRVTCDKKIVIMSPSGNCLGTLPDRYECKVYNKLNIQNILKKYKLKKTFDRINKRVQAFLIVDHIQLDAFKFLPDREIEIKFESKLNYRKTINALKKVDISKIKFIWQSFEHTEENTHVYYRSKKEVFREIFIDNKLQAIVKKSDKQSIDREEKICTALPKDAVLLGSIDRKKFKSYIVDTISGHCFQIAVDQSIRHKDKSKMVQLEAEYIRSIYPWSTEKSIIPTVNKLKIFLENELKNKVQSTVKRKVDFITEKK